MGRLGLRNATIKQQKAAAAAAAPVAAAEVAATAAWGGAGGGGTVIVVVADDEIAGGITKDQFARREDEWKGRMDPMSLFVKSCPPSGDADDVVGFAGDGNGVTRCTRRCWDDDDDGGGDADEDRESSRR